MSLKLITYQLGMPRQPGEGLRLGVVRRPPRGVRKADYARLDYYDVWLPVLAPSAPLLSWIHGQDLEAEAVWRRFTARYRAEMLNQTDARQAVLLLARLAAQTPIALGCHCADERRCHRSLLYALVQAAT